MQGSGAASPGHEELLARREWIRGLARVLAADGASADDLEQETLTAALRSPPPGGGYPRAWLATVMRNFARRSHRDEGRVRRREEAAARPEAGEGAADVVARADAHRRVVDAVMALPEPARTAVLLRFYDGLPPREVAARTGVAVETARTRLKRALADLKARLGGERGREGLLGLLVPLLRPEKGIVAGVTGGIAMSTAAKVGFAAGAALLVTGGVVVWTSGGNGDGAPPPRSTTAAAAPAPAPAPAVPAPAPAPETKAPPPPPPSPAPEKPKRTEAEILAGVVPGFEFRDGTTLANALEFVAKAVDVSVEYETPELQRHCETSPIPPFRLNGIPLRDVVPFLLANARSPDPKKAMLWRIRESALFIHLGVPPTPDPVKEQKPQVEVEREQKLIGRLQSEKTAFAFDGQTLPEAIQYLSARHGINIGVLAQDMAKAQAVVVKLSLKDVLLTEALDELVRLDPDFLWEVKGDLVVVRRR